MGSGRVCPPGAGQLFPSGFCFPAVSAWREGAVEGPGGDTCRGEARPRREGGEVDPSYLRLALPGQVTAPGVSGSTPDQGFRNTRV